MILNPVLPYVRQTIDAKDDRRTFGTAEVRGIVLLKWSMGEKKR